ncbi:hypothetical protein DE146DRAFT_438614 [Phaeosphaeria sp. MPI-PUGE-AT-0046c]|nr:hypothetical protein DE146DRAFT_438614 [Phaeosphaeria sp. MPI-PUGE-AT-0046c]
MSDVAAAEAVSSPSSGSTFTVIDAAGDEMSISTHHMPQTPSPDHTQPQLQLKSKRYTPPKADSDTFPTQQAFLDSLQPMPLEQVDVEKRKCPICWKFFGEAPDPGFDNSEMPVKLRCHHVFGHKCLADIFGIPTSTSLQIQPLQYTLGRRGHLLGQKLAAYHAMHGAKFRDDLETFEHMLTVPHRERGTQVFSQYWWDTILQILHSHRGLSQITLMENAVVLDYEPLTAKKHQPTQPDPAIPPQYLNAASNLGQTMLDAAAGYGMDMQAIIHSEDMALTTAWSSSSSTSSQSTPAPGYVQLSNSQSIATAEIPLQIDKATSTTWEEALTGETNLDKLKALQKQKENAEQSDAAAAQKLEALKVQEAAMEEARKQEAQRAHAAMERRKHDIRTLLAHRLSDVFANYKGSQVQESEEVTSDSHARVIHASVSIHADDDFEKTTYAIAPPMMGPFYDDDGDSDNEETEDLANATIMILRTQCGGCCASLQDRALPTPKELTWRNSKNTPDSCPLCHKVLFKKAAGR